MDKLNIIRFPDDETVCRALREDVTMMAAISYDCTSAVLCRLDNGMSHRQLIEKADIADTESFFLIVFDGDGAEWTFVCPPDYKGISDNNKRIKQFHKDGTNAIIEFLHELDLIIDVRIPKHYRRQISLHG